MIKLNLNKNVEYWFKQAERDLKDANDLFEVKKYTWALFVGNLAVEKILKALYVQEIKDVAPKSHKLNRLYRLSNGKFLNIKEIEDLKVITEFNLEARYPEDLNNFYKKCTKNFAEKNMKLILNVFEKCKQEIKS